MSDVKQTMISVKKSDGTTVKMSLSDFKKYQAELAQKKNSAPVPTTAPAPASVVLENNLPAKIQNESVATSTPVVKAFVNEAEAVAKSEERVVVQRPPVRLPVRPVENKPKQWSREDYSSPLAEKSSPGSQKNEQGSNLVEDMRKRAERVVGGMNFSIPDGVRSRMVNLVSSVISGARDRNTAIEYATRPIANGGLGLSEEQVSLLMVKVGAEMPKDFKSYTATHVLPENLRPKTPIQNQSVLPPKKMENTVTPVQKLDRMVRAEAVRSTPVTIAPKSVVSAAPSGSIGMMGAKTKISDMKPSIEPRERLTTGPVDEFAGMTLRDWRRMAVNTEGSLSLLQGKFAALSSESYTLFLAGRDGWRASPLFGQYVDVVRKTLSERRSVEDVLSGSGENILTLAEFRALVELNESISN